MRSCASVFGSDGGLRVRIGKGALLRIRRIGLALRWKPLTLSGSEVPNSPPFLPRGVTVALATLDRSVMVRIHARQEF